MQELRSVWLRLKEALLRGDARGVGQGTGVLIRGTLLSQLIGALAIPVLTRLYLPEHFGQLALFVSLVSVFSIVAALKYELAIPLTDTDQQAAGVLLVALIVLGGVVGLGLVILATPAFSVVRWLGGTDLAAAAWVFPLGVMLVGGFEILRMWTIRQRRFRRLSIAIAAQGLGVALGQLALAPLIGGSLALVYGYLGGRAISTVVLLVRNDLLSSARGLGLKELAELARRFSRFPIFASPAGLLNSLGLEFPSLAVVSLFGTEVGGWFSLARRVTALPVTLISTNAAQVYYSEAAALARTNRRELETLFINLVGRLALVAALPAAALLVAGPRLFDLVFGPEWTVAGGFAGSLSFMLVFQFAVAPVSQTLNLLERQTVQLAWDAVRLATAVLAFVVPAALARPAGDAVLSYSLTMSLAYILLFFLARRAISGRAAPAGQDLDRVQDVLD